MGIYIFSMRAKTVSLSVSAGIKVRANLYSYAYRYESMYEDNWHRGERGYAGYNLTRDNTVRHAGAACNGPRSGYVILGDPKRGLENDAVYTNVTNGIWYDTDKFPGTLVGWVEKVGNGYRISNRTAWSGGSSKSWDENLGLWVPFRDRLMMVDGKAERQVEYLPVSCSEVYEAKENPQTPF